MAEVVAAADEEGVAETSVFFQLGGFLEQRSAQGKVFLFFGAKYRHLLLYDEEFRAYGDRPALRYITAVSREGKKNPFPKRIPTPGNKMYVHVRLWEHREEVCPSLRKPDTVVYLCGLKSMESGIHEVIDQIGQECAEPNQLRELSAGGRLLAEVY